MAEPQPLEAEAIFKMLVARGVDFVVVGGLAAVLHGSPRNTWDLDLGFATDAANLTALGNVLIELGARLYGIEEDVPFVPDADTLRRTEILTLSTDLGKVDLLTRPQGAPRYELLREHAVAKDIDGVRVLIASIPDLIAMKSAAGRPKDLADIAELEAIQRLS
ncbi:MAG: DUF6036 family nucleotidyltransferase [Baekduia sp.]